MVFVLCLTLFGACKKDFLTVESSSQLTLDNYFTSYEECREATAALYNIVWYDFSTQFYYTIGDGRADNLFTPYGSGTSLINLTETSSDGTLFAGFQSLYLVITQSDYLVNNIDKALKNGVTQAQVNACKGEARFMRGLAYWYAASTWGNVPIIEDPAATALNYQVPPNTFEDVLQYAIRDLQFAAEWLPDSDIKGRLTKSSANGILARLYITAACYARGNKFSSKWTTTAEAYYDMAKAACEKVLADGNYSLMSDYEQLFRVQNNNNSESLFALQFVPGSSTYGTGNRNQDWLAYSTTVTGGLTAYGGSLFASGDLVQIMHNRGELSRKKATFFYLGATYSYLTGNNTDGSPWTIKAADYRYPNIKKGVVGGPNDTEGFAINGNSGLAIPMLRLSEVYLLYAESILGLHSSTTDANALLYFNKVRTRAGMPTVDSIDLQTIWDERRVEFAMEGQFWYDMVRRAYWDQDWVLNYMNSQHRNQYYYYLSGSAPNGFVWRDVTGGMTSNKATVDRLLLPYPETELVLNPLLKADPVPFDFN